MCGILPVALGSIGQQFCELVCLGREMKGKLWKRAQGAHAEMNVTVHSQA